MEDEVAVVSQESGRAKLIPGGEVFARLREKRAARRADEERRMVIEEFENFVASQVASQVDSAWAAAERDEWLAHLDLLYEQILSFLSDYLAAGSIKYSFSEVEITVEEIGVYRAKSMEIRIGRQRISLVPVGTLLIAFKGRVDVTGSAGRARLVLADERVKTSADLTSIRAHKPEAAPLPQAEQYPSPKWVWKIVQRERRFVDLTRESFFEMLIEISNA